jgi:hypothetical protein
MSKYPNPVRGYVTCPVCHTESTVHQVGEGRLIAEGEPPKNSRNLGLMYYRCPHCGNSSLSKSVHEYIETSMYAEASTVKPVPETYSGLVSGEEASEPETVLSEPVQCVESTEKQHEQHTALTSDSKVANTPDYPPVIKRVLLGLGLMLFLVWSVKNLMKRHHEQSEVNHV